MHILVTGGAGYIGSHVVLALQDAGHQPIIIDNLSNSSKDNLPANVPFYYGAVGDASLLTQIFAAHPIQGVIHLAASISVPESVAQPLAYYENNVAQTLVLLTQCVKHNIANFVFSSTAAVYGNPQQTPVAEDAPLVPISPYGHSKLMAEQIIRDTALANPSFHTVTLRYFNVAGADQALRTGQTSKNATHLIKLVGEAALGKRPTISVYGSDYPTPDGSGVRDYIHVSDLATAHVQALDYLQNGGANVVLNCGYGQGYSVLEVIAAAEKVIGHPLNKELLPRRAGDPASLVANAELIKQLLGFTPKHHDLVHIIATALAWERHCLSKQIA